MTGVEIIAKVKDLSLPEGSYVVFGSCPLALAGIREAKDIDLLVSQDTLELLKQKGWQKVVKSPGDEPYVSDIFEAHPNWDFSPYSPTLARLLQTASITDGIPFASLDEVRKWKAASGGAKHEADVALIDTYLARKKGVSVSDSNLEEVIEAWKAQIATIGDWQLLTEGVEAKVSGCGLIYELERPESLAARINEDFCIADMRELKVAEPHYHPEGVTEIYFVLTGLGKVVVGTEEHEVGPGDVVVMTPHTAHFTIPHEDLVIGVVNTPPFQPEQYIPVHATDPAVQFDEAFFDRLTAAA